MEHRSATFWLALTSLLLTVLHLAGVIPGAGG